MKTAIIAIGGGMRSAYGAGFLCAMREKLSLPEPDIIIAVSGSAGGVCYLATRQYAAVRHIWTKLLSTSRFISPWRFWRILNVDYLVDVVFKKLEPLNVVLLRQAKTRILVSVVNIENGKVEFLDMQTSSDPMELLRATKASPFFYGKSVAINGKRYIDGGFGVTPQQVVNRAIELGADRIFCINDSPRMPLSLSRIFRFIAPVAPKIYRAAFTHYPDPSPHPTVPQGKNLMYVLKKDMPANYVTHDSKTLERIYNLGVEDATVMAGELRTLFSDTK